MRRIDILGIGVGILLAGGGIFATLRFTGLDSISAGIWSQVVMVGGLLGWLSTYLLRVFTQSMTFNQQLEDYETAVLQRRLDELSPEQLAAIQAQIEADEE